MSYPADLGVIPQNKGSCSICWIIIFFSSNCFRIVSNHLFTPTYPNWRKTQLSISNHKKISMLNFFNFIVFILFSELYNIAMLYRSI